MKVIEIISGLELIAQRFKLSKDFPISRRNLLFMLNNKREKQIREYVDRGDEIDPTWVQRLGVLPVTLVTKTDDPSIPESCKSIGKFAIPAIISLPGDRGLYRVSKPSNNQKYYNIDFNSFYEMDASVAQFHENYVWREEATFAKIHPYTPLLQVYAIPQNPMDATVIETTDIQSGNLVYTDDYHLALEYVVYDGLVIHDETEYKIGESFVAVNNVYEGPGKVKLKNSKRPMTLNDTYPIDGNMLNTVILRIMTEDFRLTKEQILDVENDAQISDKITQAN
jgi:hypothetical protein